MDQRHPHRRVRRPASLLAVCTVVGFAIFGPLWISDAEALLPPIDVPGVVIPPVAIPSVTIPQVSVPSVTIPPVSLPVIVTPPVSTPEIVTPPISTPEMATPEIGTPSLELPAITTPGVSIPSAEIPGVSLPATTLPSGATTSAATPSSTSASAPTESLTQPASNPTPSPTPGPAASDPTNVAVVNPLAPPPGAPGAPGAGLQVDPTLTAAEAAASINGERISRALDASAGGLGDGDLAQQVAQFFPPIGLLIAILAYLLLQDRFDRRDPKLVNSFLDHVGAAEGFA